MIGDAVGRLSSDVAENVSDRIAAVGLKLALFCAAGVAVCGAIAAAIMAFFWWLQPEFGPVASALMAAAALLALASVAYVAAKVAGKPPAAPEIKPLEVLEEETRETVDTMGTLQFVLAAAGIGALIGMRLTGKRSGVAAGPSLTSMIAPAMSLYAALTSTDAAHKAETVSDTNASV